MSKSDLEFMVESQIKARGIKDERILNAFLSVDRKFFVPLNYISEAYKDSPIPIGFGQTTSQPAMIADILNEAEIEEGDKVLEVGAGSGYLLALLLKLGASPYGVERIKELADRIQENLRRAGLNEIPVKVGDGTLGWEENSPFDKIIISAASSKIPDELLNQLKMGGVLLAPIGGSQIQQLTIVRKTEKGLIEEKKTPCVFVPLISG